MEKLQKEKNDYSNKEELAKLVKSMKAAIYYNIGDIRYEEVNIPEVDPQEVLLKVKAAGICGSDVFRVMKAGSYSHPLIPGHEFSGEVVEIGKKVTNVKVGDRVVAIPLIPCRKCNLCNIGQYSLCENYNYLGSRSDGGFAEFAKLPQGNLLKLPSSLSYEEAAMVEPAAVALHGVLRAEINIGNRVAVLGGGSLGLLAVQWAKIMGATQIYVVDIVEEKLKIAKEVGANYCINAKDTEPVKQIMSITKNNGVDVAIEAVGSNVTREQSLRLTTKLGKVLCLGSAYSQVIFPANVYEYILRHELTILGSWNSYSAPFPGREWRNTLYFLQNGRLKVKPLITHKFKLKEVSRVFQAMLNQDFTFGKVLFVS